jgi:hypothetical protein
LFAHTHTHTYIQIWDGAGKDQGIKQVKIFGGYEKPKHISIHATITTKCRGAQHNLKNWILTAQNPILLLVSWKSQTENFGKEQYFQTLILQLLLILLLTVCVN